MANLFLKHVYKVYNDGTVAVSDLNLDIPDGEFLILVGPSGCGKSTTLRMIAGLEDITAGDFYIGETRANALEPKERKMAMVFQNYALYPHMNVFENMAFGLRINHLGKDEIDSRIRKAAEILGLTNQLNKKPKDMSGGQRQRVALGRAIVRKPSVFLLDEPLSNLDAKLRASMRSEIRRLHDRLKTTFIYVTHDQVEAMTMGTKIVVMNKGFVQQIDSPMNLYDFPVNLFVAGFIGTPQMNFFDATSYIDEEKISFSIGNTKLECPLSTFPKLDILHIKQNPLLTLGIRPEHMQILSHDEKENQNCFHLEVSLVESLGNETICEGLISGTNISISTKIGRNDHIQEGDIISLKIDFAKIHLFSKESTKTLCPRIPDNIYLKLSQEKTLFNKKINFNDEINKSLLTIAQPYLSIPSSAIIPGNSYQANIVNQEFVNGTWLLCLETQDHQNFYVSSKQKINEKEYSFDIKEELISLYDDSSLVNDGVPEISHLQGKLSPVRRTINFNGKMRKKMVFDYEIEGVKYRPSDDKINRIYALLGKKFHLHTIDFSFHPRDVKVQDEGLAAKVEHIYKYANNCTFAKVKINQQEIFIRINEDIKEGDIIHIGFDADSLRAKDVNFNVIMLQ